MILIIGLEQYSDLMTLIRFLNDLMRCQSVKIQVSLLRMDAMRFSEYQTDNFYDEMFEGTGAARNEARLLLETIESLDEGQLQRCQRAAERLLLQLGITFNVYGDSQERNAYFRSTWFRELCVVANGSALNGALSSASAR